MNRTKKTLITIFLACLIAAMTGFIFSQSMKTGEESASFSARVTSWLLGALGKIFSFSPPQDGSSAFEITHTLVRKAAHFTEFFVLGMLWLLFTATLTGRIAWRRGEHSTKRALYFIVPPCAPLLTAIIDECVQIFSKERGPSVLDVGIDFLGACAGVLAAHALLYAAIRLLAKRAKKDKDEGALSETNENNDKCDQTDRYIINEKFRKEEEET